MVRADDREFTTRSIIIATGGAHNKLGAPGEDEFAGRGVSYCAVCDGNFFRGQDVVVVGGGDSAIDEGLYLSGIVNSVTVVHRRDELRATRVLQERAFARENVKFLWSHIVEEFVGNEALEAARVKDLKSEEIYDYPTAAAFIYVGFHPQTDYLKGLIDMDSLGHVYTDIHKRTKAPGVLRLRRRPCRFHPPVGRGSRRWHHRRPCRLPRPQRLGSTYTPINSRPSSDRLPAMTSATNSVAEHALVYSPHQQACRAQAHSQRRDQHPDVDYRLNVHQPRPRIEHEPQQVTHQEVERQRRPHRLGWPLLGHRVNGHQRAPRC